MIIKTDLTTAIALTLPFLILLVAFAMLLGGERMAWRLTAAIFRFALAVFLLFVAFLWVLKTLGLNP